MSSIGFGTWSWGNKFLWGYNKENDDENIRNAFFTAIKGGLNLIDTADSYGTGSLEGRSELLLGKFIEELPLKLKRKLKVTTKLAPYPWRIGRNGFYDALIKSKKRLRGNLKRVQLHWSTSKYAPWQEIQLIDGLSDFKESGIIDEIGLSNIGPKKLVFFYERLLKRGIKIKSLQTQFSLLSPNKLKSYELISICKELNIDLLAYSPLGLGLLALNPTDKSLPKSFLRRQIFRKLLPETKKLREALHQIAISRKVSQNQVALNWCRSHGTIPIPGIRKKSHAIDSVNALKWQLTTYEKNFLDEEIKELSVSLPENPFQSS